MASTRSTIDLIISGSLHGLTEATATAKAELAALEQRTKAMKVAGEAAGKTLLVMGKSMLALSAASGAIQLVGGLVAVLQQLLPIVLLAPAGILTLVAAFATLKIGFSGFGDAVKNGGEDLAKLAPQARAAATAIRALGPAFHDVQQATQNTLFKDIAADVRDLGAIYLPILQRRLPLIAAGFNAMGRSIAFALKRPSVSDDIGIVLVNTAKLITNARNALGAFATGFINLAGIGSTYLPRVGIAIDGVAQRFQRFVEAAGTDGRIRGFIDRAIAGFRDLIHIVEDVGSIFLSVFQGLAGPQGDVLASLRETTDALAGFLQTASAQTALGALGDALRAVATATRDVLLEALKQLAPIIQDLAPFVVAAADAFGKFLVNALKIVGPILDGVAKFLSANKDIVIPLIPLLAGLGAKFLLLKIGTSIIGGLTSLGRALGGVRNVLALGGWIALGLIADKMNDINLAAANGDPAKLDLIGKSLFNIVGAGKEILSGDFPGIISQITDQVNQVNDTWAQGKAPIQVWFDTVKTSFENDFVGALRRGSDAMDTFFADIRDRIVTSFENDFVKPIGKAIDTVVDFVTKLPERIGTAIGDLAGFLQKKAEDGWEGFKRGAKAKIDEAVLEVKNLPGDIAFAIGFLGESLYLYAIDAWNFFVRGAKLVIDIAIADVKALPGKIKDGLSTLGDTLKTAATDAWNFFLGVAQQKVDETKHEAEQAPAKVGGALSDFGATLLRIATDAWTGFLKFAQDTIAQDVAEAKAIPGKIADALSTLVDVLIKAATDGWNGFLNGARVQIAIAVSDVKQLPGKIIAAIGDLAGKLTQIGADAIAGLGRGISNGFGAIQSAVSSFVDRLIAGARYALDSHSPSRKFQAIGSSVGEGWLLGQDASFKGVIANAQAHTDALIAIGQDAASSSLIGTARAFDRTSVGLGAASTSGAQIGAQAAPTYVIPISIGDEVVRTVRGEIDASNREVKRTVNAGSGVTAG